MRQAQFHAPGIVDPLLEDRIEQIQEVVSPLGNVGPETAKEIARKAESQTGVIGRDGTMQMQTNHVL